MSYDVWLDAGIEVPELDVNITYNVGRLMKRAGIHPMVLNGLTVEAALPVFYNAVELIIDNREYFDSPVFLPANGWGTYETTRDALIKVLKALEGCNQDQRETLRLRFQ